VFPSAKHNTIHDYISRLNLSEPSFCPCDTAKMDHPWPEKRSAAAQWQLDCFTGQLGLAFVWIITVDLKQTSPLQVTRTTLTQSLQERPEMIRRLDQELQVFQCNILEHWDKSESSKTCPGTGKYKNASFRYNIPCMRIHSSGFGVKYDPDIWVVRVTRGTVKKYMYLNKVFSCKTHSNNLFHLFYFKNSHLIPFMWLFIILFIFEWKVNPTWFSPVSTKCTL